jgi:hypothetical protein
MFTVITEAYYETAIDKWRLTNYEEAVSYFREAGNFCDAIKAGAKGGKLKESIAFFCHFFKSLKDLAIFDCEFQKIFDSSDFKELFSSCIMTAEVALNLDILKKANENRKYLDKWKEKFPVFHVIFNARMFCLFSLFNTLIPLWGHLLTKEGKGVLDPQKFRPYELDLDFEKSRNILANLGFLKAKQALDALENFILALTHYRNHKKIEDFTFEEVAELFGILNAGSMRTSKSYIGFVVQGIEELKQKHLDLEKLITPKMRKELWSAKPSGKEEAKGEKAEYKIWDSKGNKPIFKNEVKKLRNRNKKGELDIFVDDDGVVYFKSKKVIELKRSQILYDFLVYFLKNKSVGGTFENLFLEVWPLGREKKFKPDFEITESQKRNVIRMKNRLSTLLKDYKVKEIKYEYNKYRLDEDCDFCAIEKSIY